MEKQQENNTTYSIPKAVLFSILATAFAAVLFYGGQIVGGIMLKSFRPMDNKGLNFAIDYGTFIGVWILCLLGGLAFKMDRKNYSKVKFHKEKIKRSLILGLTTGFGLNLFLGILAMLHGDFKLYFNEFNIGMVLLFIFTVTIQSSAEELICRWFLYESLRKYFPKWPMVAIIVTALFFGANHIGNHGATVLPIIELVLTGILYAMIVYYFDSFWGASIAHAGWNFCQSILLGLPNSGNESDYSVFKLGDGASNSLFYNVDFGIEGSIMSVTFVILACLVVFWFGRKYKAKKQA